MREVTGDLWGYRPPGGGPVVRCVTTNGKTKANGHAVMGRGCAKEAATKYPLMAKVLGEHLRERGNVPMLWESFGDPVIRIPAISLLTFPTKHVWWDPADPDLIVKSAEALEHFATARPDTTFVLPRPGCGNGNLRWDDVRPLLTFLPDNVVVISKEGEV